MKKSYFAILFLAIGVSACVQTNYSKMVSVTKDESGKIIQTVETEGVVQPGGNGWPIKFEHLKGIQPTSTNSTTQRE